MRWVSAYLRLSGCLAVVVLVGLWVSAAEEPETPEEIRAGFNAGVDALEGKTRATVVVARVEGEIDLRQVGFLRRVVSRVKETKPALFVMELNTPGGDGNCMEQMGNELLSLSPTPTVCFIDSRAISAGVYLAICCDSVYMNPTATMGASTPWYPDPQKGGLPAKLPEDIERKMYRAAEGTFRSIAQRKGYDADLVDAMLDPDAEVFHVSIKGKDMLLRKAQLESRRSAMMDEIQGSAAARQKQVDEHIKVVKTFKQGPLVLTSGEAMMTDLVNGVVADRDALFETLGLEDPQVEEMVTTWSETVFGFLAGRAISGLLFTAGLVALYIELRAPGFGLPGIVGIVCIGLALSSSYFVGLASHTELLIIGIGALLLLIEVFVTPGFGLLGGTGIVLIIVGAFLSGQYFMVPDIGKLYEWDAFKENVMVMSLSIIAFFISVIVLAKILPGIPILNKLVLRSAGPGSSEELVGSAGSTLADVEIGATGTTLSLLRPSGRARFGDKSLDVMTRGEFIEVGQDIEVLETKGNRILVRAVRTEPENQT